MKLCVVSDIHGSQTAAEKAVKMFENEKCDYMLLLVMSRLLLTLLVLLL